MRWEFYLYWAFYIITFGVECYFDTMPIWASYAILTSYWLSYIFLGFIFGAYKYLELAYKDIYLEGLLVAFISRSFLQIISIFGYQEKKYVIVITGFCLIMWIAIWANRNLKNKLSKTNLL